MDSNSTSRKHSIMEYLTDKNSDAMNSLKEFHELLKQNAEGDESGALSDETHLKQSMKALFDSSIQRNNANNSTINKKNDLAIKILEFLSLNPKMVAQYKINMHSASMLDKNYFDKLLMVFQSGNPDIALRIVKYLIAILGKALHHNLSIINPLLQVIELSFKHSNSEIKSLSYDCWGYLINNFALDQDFLLKPKKFNLIQMPLINKCKAYKEEEVSRTKIISWLYLIESINEKIPSYIYKVLIPFFNYCLGFNSLPDYSNDNLEDASKVSKHFSTLYKTDLKPEHHSQKLNQIGFEVFISFIFNGDLSWLTDDLKKKFKHVNLNRNYNIKDTLNDSILWLHLIKYFFQVFMTKTNSSYDSLMLLYAWKRICQLFGLKYKDQIDQCETSSTTNEYDFESFESSSSSSSNHDDQMETESVEISSSSSCSNESNQRNDLIELFLLNTIDNIKSFNLNNTSNMTLMIHLTKSVLTTLKYEYSKRFSNKGNEFKEETLKMFKKSARILLNNEEENFNSFMLNLTRLIKFTESDSSVTDLFGWLDLSNKFHEYLRSLKSKTTVLQLNETTYETLNLSIIYPFKYFKSLEIQEADIKVIISSCTNVCKSLCSLIKLNRIKYDNNQHLLNVNTWFLHLFSHLTLKYDQSDKATDPEHESWLLPWFSNYHHQSAAKTWHINTESSTSSANFIESTLKLLHLQTQFSLLMLQNVCEFDLINQQQQPIQKDSSSIMASLGNEPSKRAISESMFQSNYSNLVDLIQKQVKLFYDFIKSQPSLAQSKQQAELQSVGAAAVIDEDETSLGNKSINKSENKQTIQIYCNLIEQLSILFTRIKAHDVLEKLLIKFATSIEYLSELNSISKTSDPNISPNKQSKDSKHKTIHVSFQFTRRSSDLYDTFSMQIASYIQNHLNKTYYQHEFDSMLLNKLEPVFYSFLKYSKKLSLKQKTLQAWNGTFGKSTDERLNYSSRLEKLFIDLREEMINKSRSVDQANNNGGGGGGGGGGGNNGESSASTKSSMTGLIALSLPGLKSSFDLDNTTNTQSSNNIVMLENYDFLFNDEEDNQEDKEDKENGHKISSTASSKSSKLKASFSALLDDGSCASSSSVPMAQLTIIKQPLGQQNKIDNLSSPTNFKKINQQQQQQQQQTVNFVFSPASANHNSFANKSMSTSKIFKTPDDKSTKTSSRPSPRSLRHTTKRKLDLNGLIDQMPDKDFVEIFNKKKQQPICNLSNKFDEDKGGVKAAIKSVKKPTQPLTEHQKEMRKKKSFIPIEMQSMISNEMDTQTMDSQMSCATTQDGLFQAAATADQPKQTTLFINENNDENACDVIENKELITDDSSSSSSSSSDSNNKVADSVKPIQSDSSLSNDDAIVCTQNNRFKFKSKINPKKQIELIEISNTSNQSVQIVEPVTASNSQINEPESAADSIKRRSARLKSKEPAESAQLSNEFMSQSVNILEQMDKKLSEDKQQQEEEEEIIKTTAVKNTLLKAKIERLKLKKKLIESTTSTVALLHGKNTANNRDVISRRKGGCLVKKSSDKTKLGRKNNSDKRKRIDSYRKLICSLKNDELYKNDTMFNNATELNKIKSKEINEIGGDKEDVMRIDEEKTANKEEEASVVEPLIPLAETTKQLVANKQNEDPEEDENVPLSKLTERGTRKRERQQSVENQPLQQDHKMKKSNLSVESDNQEEKISKITEIECLTTITTTIVPVTEKLETVVVEATKLIVESSPSTLLAISKPSTSVAIEAQTNSAKSATVDSSNTNSGNQAIALALQKLNDTPTSILKRRTTRLINQSDKNSKSSINDSASLLAKCLSSELTDDQHATAPPANNNLNAFANNNSNGTPNNKRRVSFCDAVQIEEIEPNNNKSYTRLSHQPRIQNRAKLVLSPYFSSKNQSPSSLPISSNTNNSNSIGLSTSASNTTNSSLMSPLNSRSQNSTSTASTNPNNSSPSLSSSSSSSSLNIIMNNNTNISNIGNNSINAASAQNNPSSPVQALNNPTSSLIDFFSNNKQSFLSSRASIIQQQIKQNQLNRTENNNNNNNNNVALSSPVLPSKSLIPTTKLTGSVKTTTINQPEAKVIDEQSKVESKSIYPALKDSTEAIDLSLVKKEFSNYFETSDWIDALKSKNILTIGNLCSLSLAHLDDLPFKMPKMKSFMSLIKSYEKQTSKNDQSHINDVLSKLSNYTTSTFLGSVEEEMAKLEKLESSTGLNTSIECEAFNDIQAVLIDSSEPETDDDNIFDNNKNKKPEQPAMEVDVVVVARAESNPNPIESLKSWLISSNKDLDDIDLKSLNVNDVNNLSDYIEGLEMRLIQLKRKLRLEMINKYEQIKK